MIKYKPTPMQEAMLYETQNAPGRYITTLRYALDEPTNDQALSRRLNLLIRRHEILRTRYVRDANGILWLETGEEDAGHFRASLLRTDELSVEFNHVLLDGWSVANLMRELMAAEDPGDKASPFRYYTKWLERRNAADDVSFWESYLDDADISELPNRTSTTGYERQELLFTIDNSELLRNIARELRITAGRLIQSVWNMLVARYNGGESIVCTVNSGRSAPIPGIGGMAGMCVNTLPIVTKLPKPPESMVFSDWVHNWSRQTTDAEKHGFCALGDLISGTLPHILSIDPPFDGAGCRLMSSNATLVTDFDAAFTLRDEITAEFAYNACVYSDESLSAIQGHFITMLNAVLTNPHIPVEQIPILTEAEKSELTALNENADILDVIDNQTVIDLWRASAEQHASREALVCGNVRLTYTELSNAVNRLASALRSRGVGTETPVSIMLPRSEKYVITELAVVMAGGFFLPLDPNWPEHRIHTIINETNPKLVIDKKTYDELLAHDCQSSTYNYPLPHDAAYMIMTSGTTGAPKGVVIEHRSFLNFCLWAKKRYGWQTGNSCALELGFAFDGSIWSIYPPLISGGTLHILPDEVRFDLNALGGYCRAEHITHIDLPVTMAEAFREIFRDENELPDLRVMVTGGEEVRRVVPSPYPLSNEYGPTECTVCCCAGWINDGDSPITLGSPPPNMNAYILDEWGRLCPDGVTGEAYFSGVQVARGYYNAPKLTAERFTVNPFAGGRHSVLYRTGDLMRQIKRDGRRELVFMGRADNQVKLNGFRIELAEIENVLRSHPYAHTATAFVRENQLCAYVVPSGTLDKSELYALIDSKLPAFMRPMITIVKSIPLTSSGKVDFTLLQSSKMEKAAVASAPETEREKMLVSAVSRLLGVTDIGTGHNYLELGGNSINAMRISFCLETEGYVLSAKELIASVNFSEAAAKMRVADDAGDKALIKATFVPLAAQQAMVFLAETDGSAMYTVTATLDAADLDAETLQKRINRAAKLHDILRAVFERDKNGIITGRICDTHRIRLNAGNFDDAGGIDPLRGPLLDLKLSDGVLTIRYHHIALDGYSLSLLIQELLFDQFPETAPSFAEFANRLASQTDRHAADAAWWREQCRDVKIVPLLPPKTKNKPVYRRINVCSSELLRTCTETAKAARVTPAAFTLAAWSVVVHALGGEDGDMLIPFAASCRGEDTLMGMCAATIPLKLNLRDAGEAFNELARRVQDNMLDSVSHWFVPQEIIHELPDCLFVFEDGTADYSAGGEQNYDLVIKFSDICELIYNAARLPDANAKRIAAFLETALTEAVRNRISFLGEAEYELVTESFSHGRTLGTKYQTAAEMVISAAETYAGRAALETENGTLTYAQVYERAKMLCGEIRLQGLGAGDIVAFCLPRNAEGVIAQLGITLSGAAFLPLDPTWPEGRVNDILSDSGAAAVVKDGFVVALTCAHGKVPSDTAYIIYTSGTTGRPKGVVVPQTALVNQIVWAIDEFGFSSDDKMLHYIAFTFDPSVWVLYTALASGAMLLLLPDDMRFDPQACARYIAGKNITRCTLPSAAAPDILRRVEDSRLRTVFLGGEAVSKLPPCDFEVVNCYGPTEACINASFYRLESGETETRVIGHPVANTSCYVLDTRGKPCPIGIPGELHIGGVQLAHGYINRSEESASVFIEHPRFGRLYKTGDRAEWNADGTLTFLGRRDSQVKIRGHRVELSEIEFALREIPGVSDAKVLYRDGALDAYIIASGQTDTTALKKRLPSYMLPRSVTVMKEFPLTENGKVDVKAFPEPTTATVENEEPLSDIENVIASAWKIALGLAPDFVVKRFDSFFALGGHSLLLFHVTGLLSASGVTADIKTLIANPVLADLSEAIARREVIHAPKPNDNKSAETVAYKRFMQSMELVDLSEKRAFRNILITGGTGFLGSHLVREFYEHTDAVIHLPIRGDISKLRDVLEYYFGASGTEMAASDRLRVTLCDISEKPPYPDAPLDAIFHAAADIRHYAPEPEMYRANVAATENMLTLVRRDTKTLFAHISTTSAVNALNIFETDADLGPAFDNVYQRTKQQAERCVLDAGQRNSKYAIFRVGHVSPGFESGSVARNWEINAMLRLTGAMLLTELLPEQDYNIGYGYADKTARAIRLLTEPVSLENRIFHIDNPNTLRLSEIFALVGLRGIVLPKAELLSQLTKLSESTDAAVRAAASEYLGRLAQGSLEKDSADIVAGSLHMDVTLLLLKRLGFEWPHVTKSYIQGIIQSLRNKGGLPK